MKDLFAYSLIGLAVLFTVGQFAAHLPQRYHREGVARPYTFRDRLVSACEGWWVPLIMCGSLYAVAVPFVFVYGVWKHKPTGFVLNAYGNHWQLLLGLAVACIIEQIGKGLAFAAQNSESFKEHTNRRLAAIESELRSTHEQQSGRSRG